MNAATRVFYLLRDYCPSNVMTMIYHALVMSKLQYGLSCWGGCYMNTFKPLYIQQKMILRIILRKRRVEPSWPLFKTNNILPLQHLYIFKVLRLFYRRSGQRNMRVDVRYNLRVNQQLIFNVPRFNTDHYRRYYIVTAPTFFNALPISVKRHFHYKTFLGEVRKWLLKTSDVSFLYRVLT